MFLLGLPEGMRLHDVQKDAAPSSGALLCLYYSHGCLLLGTPAGNLFIESFRLSCWEVPQLCFMQILGVHYRRLGHISFVRAFGELWDSSGYSGRWCVHRDESRVQTLS